MNIVTLSGYGEDPHFASNDPYLRHILDWQAVTNCTELIFRAELNEAHVGSRIPNCAGSFP